MTVQLPSIPVLVLIMLYSSLWMAIFPRSAVRQHWKKDETHDINSVGNDFQPDADDSNNAWEKRYNQGQLLYYKPLPSSSPPPPPSSSLYLSSLASSSSNEKQQRKEESYDAVLLPFVGNGYLATHPISSLSGERGIVYISGVFNGASIYGNCSEPTVGCSAPHRARIPIPIVDFVLDDDDNDNNNIDNNNNNESSLLSFFFSSERQGVALDMEWGLLMERRDVVTFVKKNTNRTNNNNNNAAHNNSACIRIEDIYYSHRTYRNLLVHEIVIRNDCHREEVSKDVISQLLSKGNGQGGFKVTYGPSSPKDFVWTTNKTTTIAFPSPSSSASSSPSATTIHSLQGHTINRELPSVEFVSVGVASSLPPLVPKYSNNNNNQNLKPGQSISIPFLTAFCTSLDDVHLHTSPDATMMKKKISRKKVKELTTTLEEECAHQILITHLHTSAEALRSKHISSWLDAWYVEGGNVAIEGNLTLSQAVNSSFYYMISSARVDWPLGISPGGLASDAYLGHSFWDTETWMYPPFLLLYPKLARSLLEYRLDRRQGAKNKAVRHGFDGYMFPWESAFTGEEVCGTSYGQTAPWGELEHHITGDIAVAFYQHWRATGQLRHADMDLLEGIAEYWCSRVSLRRRIDNDENDYYYHIYNVMGPDEYHFPVNDSVYTNVVASLSLWYAIEAAEASNTTGRNNIEKWRDVAERIFIPFDNTSMHYPEFYGYKDSITKQADVILIGYPLQYNVSDEVRLNNLLYYLDRTDPKGPAMTWSMFAIGMMQVLPMESTTIRNLFEKGFANQQGPFKVWTETPNGKGAVNFITGAGGFLQSIISGYGGIQIGKNELILKPHIPPGGAKSIVFRNVHFRGSRFAVKVTNDGRVFVSVLSINTPPLKDNGTSDLVLTCKKNGRMYKLTIESSPLELPCCNSSKQGGFTYEISQRKKVFIK